MSLLLPCLNSPTTITRTPGSSSRALVTSRRLARSARPAVAASSPRSWTTSAIADACGRDAAAGAASDPRGTRRPTMLSGRVRPMRTPQCCRSPARCSPSHGGRGRGGLHPPRPNWVCADQNGRSSPEDVAAVVDVGAAAVVAPDGRGVDVPVRCVHVLDLRGEEIGRGRIGERDLRGRPPRVRAERVIGVGRRSAGCSGTSSSGRWSCQLAASSLDITHTFGLGL